MDFATFAKLEAVCKRAWRGLSRTGENSKPDYLDKYESRCPACHIAFNGRPAYAGTDCRWCPIDEWRKIANTQFKGRPHDVGTSICLQDGQLYDQWCESYLMESRKSVAKKISNLKWTYLAKYKSIKL